MRLHDMFSNCSMFARRLLDVCFFVGYALGMLHICLMFARCFLDVCLVIAWSCKRSIRSAHMH